jgi:hypothetical protein
MKIKKNTFSPLVLELFFPSIANCKKLKIQKIQKSTFPIVELYTVDSRFSIMHPILAVELLLGFPSGKLFDCPHLEQHRLSSPRGKTTF